jgi:hypothetical protein
MPGLAHGLRGAKRGGGPTTYGPNLVPVGAFAISGTGVVDNGDGTLTVTAGSNAATAAKTITLEDNTTYLSEYVISGYTGGGVKTQTYGATLAHAGASTTRNANGSYSEEVTTGAAGSFTNLHRFQTTGTTGTNGYTISGVSLKKKLS